MAHLTLFPRGWKAGLGAVAALGLALPLVATTAQTRDEAPKLTEKQQTKLDRELKGRVAGEPIACISLTRVRDSTVVSDDILLYEMRDGTVFMNRPYQGCPNAEHDALVTRTPGTRLCAGDIAEVRNVSGGYSFGSCSFSKFTPYRKPDSGD